MMCASVMTVYMNFIIITIVEHACALFYEHLFCVYLLQSVSRKFSFIIKTIIEDAFIDDNMTLVYFPTYECRST